MTLLILRAALALVFVIAGSAKLRDLASTRRAAGGFGVPERLVGAVAVCLPLAELATAAALVPNRTAAAGAAAALFLLAAFVAVITANLARGRRPDCNCFGRLHSAPVGWGMIARNVGLAAVAALVLAGPVHALAGAVAVAALALAAVTTLALDRQRADNSADEPGESPRPLPIGSLAPSFELPTREGRTISLAGLVARGRPTLLVFSDPHCGPCTALAPDTAGWQRRHSDEVTIAVVERGYGGSQGLDEHGRRDVLVQRESEVADAYGARGTPNAILVDADGRIASAPAGGRVAIEALLGEHSIGFESLRPQPVPRPRGLPRREALARFAASAGTLAAAVGFPAWATAGSRPLARKRCRRDRDCAGTLQCIDSECKCPALYLDQCGNDCVDLNGDPDNCRECGHACHPGESCVGGECKEGDSAICNPPCRVGQACCLEANGPRCVDLSRGGGSHCGGCGHSCTPTEVCCDGRCKNLFQDPNRCARPTDEKGCFLTKKKKCKEGQVCLRGCRNKCPDPLTRCGDFCLDPRQKEQCCDATVFAKWDLHNCGACGHDCTKESSLKQPACCPGVGCVDLSINRNNCGACGHPCPPNCQCLPGVGGKGICTNCV